MDPVLIAIICGALCISINLWILIVLTIKDKKVNTSELHRQYELEKQLDELKGRYDSLLNYINNKFDSDNFSDSASKTMKFHATADFTLRDFHEILRRELSDLYDAISYNVRKRHNEIDYDEIRTLINEAISKYRLGGNAIKIDYQELACAISEYLNNCFEDNQKDIDYERLAVRLNKCADVQEVELISSAYKQRTLDAERIISNILHTIRTPLSGITISCTMMESEIQTDSLKNECHSIKEYADMIESNLRALKQLSSSTDDRTEESLANRLTRESQLILLAADKKIDLSVSAETDILLNNTTIDCIMLCVSCILENAIYYTRDNGKIDICLTKNDSTYEIAIKNYGEPIAEENLDKIFEEGFSTKNGSGNGLSIAKMVSQRALNGRLSAINLPGEGVSFNLVFGGL